jgi:membrane protein DedA with SNARE-associated domain
VTLLRYLLFRHGYLFVFVYVFGVQAGLPIPADPMLLVMGAIVGEGRYSLWLTLLTGMSAALLGDLIWYELGRRRGTSVLKILCRLSLEPDTCVRKTEDTFGRRGARTLLFAKFIPGLSLVSVPMAGVIRMPRSRFLLYDVSGSALWVSTYVLTGLIFRKQVQAIMDLISQLGRWGGILLVTLLALYLGFKYFQRWRFLRDFRINRLSPEKLREMLEAGVALTVVDLRHHLEVERDGLKLAGAVLMRPDELRARSREIPRDQEMILYCT